MGPTEILRANLASTRFPSLTVEATLTTTLGNSAPWTARSRTVSRFAVSAAGWELEIMSRVIEGQPVNGRFLIEQRNSGSPLVRAWRKDPHSQRADRVNFEPWEPFPGSALRWMDHILPPPGTFTAALNEAARPSDLQWQPPAPCWVVDLTLSSSFWRPGPTLMRVWIERTPGRAIDHRVEQHLGNGTVRVIDAAHWAQLTPGSPWGPALRTVTDPELDMRTTIQVDTADASSLDRHLFQSQTMAEADW